ncbi:acyl-coenzyme A thioesterase 9, mitochondrial-like [Paramacrobiotus metropolitanus]|uniref:acyl-coenzyme A thioesterase 9, mitochondrial-like n=1 Tax=Paramacrobiotus metropolitanus TaxID=2943436 RepID=UPI0024456398|nr:acyl-coenzyme A thioesterase 9, mitochondrial-like [Paramacrobiotus metropolitanus]
MACGKSWRAVQWARRSVHTTALRRPQHLCDTEPQTIAQVRDQMKSLVGYEGIFGTQGPRPDRSQLASYLAHSQAELPPRRLFDSYDEAVIPLGRDLEVREQYHNAFHRVRFGRLLEDLDTFAVWLAYKHTLLPRNPDPSRSPFGIVTGMVDRIDIENRQLPTDQDMRLRGLVSYVGQSSAEALVLMEQKKRDGPGWDHILEARFVLVARDPVHSKKAILNPLQPDGDEEQALYDDGQASYTARKQWAEDSLFKLPPNPEESRIIHDKFLQTVDPKESVFSVRVKPANSVWMEEAVLKNVHICHPQNRNIHGKIFGGFLMRNAFELAWSNAWLYGGSRPNVLSVDDIKFKRPVEIGSLLMMSARLVFTEGADMQMRVHAEVIDPATRKMETTNTFYFTFRASSGAPVRTVLPKSYAEAMLQLTGRRHYAASRHHQRLLQAQEKTVAPH